MGIKWVYILTVFNSFPLIVGRKKKILPGYSTTENILNTCLNRIFYCLISSFLNSLWMPALSLLNMALVLKVLAVFIEEDNNMQNSNICNSPKMWTPTRDNREIENGVGGGVDSRKGGKEGMSWEISFFF